MSLSSYRHAAPLEMTCWRAAHSHGEQKHMTQIPHPPTCHFDRNGAKQSGVEWRNLRSQWYQCLPLPLSFRPERSKAEWSGEISGPNGTSASPAPLSFRPQRSVVEKSPDSVGQAPMRWEISRLRVSMIYKYFIPISTRSPARDDMWAGSEPSLWEISKHRSGEKGTVKKYHIFSSQFLFIFLLSNCLPDKYQDSVFSASSSHFS